MRNLRSMVFADTIRELLPKNRFARSVSILAGGTTAGQAIVVPASPLLTRLYSPEDFGLLAVYAALLECRQQRCCIRKKMAKCATVITPDLTNRCAEHP